MTLLIVGVVGNILRLVLIEDFKGSPITGFLGILSAKFRVLLPQICLNDLSCGQEPQDGNVSEGKLPVGFGLRYRCRADQTGTGR